MTRPRRADRTVRTVVAAMLAADLLTVAALVVMWSLGGTV